jgi:hypothetical protein
VRASRVKLKLAGPKLNMSVSIPYVSIAALQLSLFEVLLIVPAATAAQSLPMRLNKLEEFSIPFIVGGFSALKSKARSGDVPPRAILAGISKT